MMDTAKQRISTKTMALIAVMTAVTCVLSPFSIPIGPVPISLATLTIYLGVYVLGMMKEAVSVIVYLLIGLVGVPVFSGFSGGPAKLIGPTGGYLVGYVFMAVVAGAFVDKFDGKIVPSVIGLLLGTVVLYAMGTVWFCIQAKTGVASALMLCVIPFIPGDIAKIIIASFFGISIRKALNRDA